ncbi:ubiquitin-like protein [Nocardia sp. NPDC051570]|uniref:ubiquitin-like protein n=1 Tax=Nocardia sp. NPDC051570 TaxID=3364324 RepID=UPI0037B7083C
MTASRKFCLIVAIAIAASLPTLAAADPGPTPPAAPPTASQLTLYIKATRDTRVALGEKLPLTGEFPIEAAPTDSIRNVKTKIDAQYEISPNHQRLTQDGNTLEDSRSLLSYNITSDTHLLLQVV